MIYNIKRYWHKILCIICAAAVVFATVLYALVPAAYADDDTLPFTDIADYSFDSWNTVDENLKNLANAYFKAFKNVGTYQYFGSVLDIPKAWVHTATDLAGQVIYTIIPVDGLFYWLDDSGNLSCYDRDLHTSHGGGAGKRRYSVAEGDSTVVSGEDFADICNRLSEQYAPKNTANRISWQTDKAFVANGYGMISFFSEGSFCNSNLSDVYMLEYYYNGNEPSEQTYYYSFIQYHFYQTVSQDDSGANVVSLYCDYWDWFNNGEKTTVLLSDQLASYRYGRISVRFEGIYIMLWKSRSDYFKVTATSGIVKPVTRSVTQSDHLYNLSDLSFHTFYDGLNACRAHSLELIKVDNSAS